MIVSNETTMINFLNLYLESGEDGKSLEELDYIAKGILYDLEANKPLEDLENYVMEESK
tara:strand:+ start:156 stop:332 length:177 start_codon:yes stop_codon:yes gene_type:complete